MKYPTIILTGCALAILPLGAEEAKKPGGGKGDGSFFKQIDKDGDKAISKEEAGERWDRLGKLDKNADGKVTLQEMAAGRAGGKGGSDGDSPGKGGPGKGGPGKGASGKGAPGKGAPGEMFKRADKNGDGKLTKDEVPEQAWARLSRLDKDEDGAVSAEEAKAGRPPGGPGGPGKGGPGSGELLKRADKNGDGNISKDEVPEQAWARLSRMDKNSDGSISKEEMEAGFAAMRAAGKGKGKGKEGKGGAGTSGRPGGGGPGAVFGHYDENKDGKLGEGEVPAEMWDRLRKADTDADGLVSKAELDAVYAEREKYSGGGADKKAEDAPKKKRPELEEPSA